MTDPSSCSTARPSRTSEAGDRGPGRFVRPPGRAGQIVGREPPDFAERGHQSPSSLAVGALEPGLAARGAGRAASRIRVGMTLRVPDTGRRDRAGRATWRPARAHGGTEVEHGLVPGPALAHRHRRVGQLLHLAAPEHPALRASQHPRRVGVDHADVALEGERQHRAGGVGPDAGQTRAARRDRRGPSRRAPRRSSLRRGAGSPPAGCSRGRPRGGRPQPAPPRLRRQEQGTARRTPRSSGTTRAACVCCSISSLTRTSHGSRVRRQGRSRRERALHSSSASGFTSRAYPRSTRRRAGRGAAPSRASRPSPCGGSSRPLRRAG